MHTFKTRYLTINYTTKEQLDKFEHKLLLHGRLKQHNSNWLDIKLDNILYRVMEILDVYPWESINFEISLFDNKYKVKKMYVGLYGLEKAKRFNAPAFMSRPDPSDPLLTSEHNIIHISVADTCIKVLSHELSHALLESWYGYKKMPNAAQHRECWYVEKEITT